MPSTRCAKFDALSKLKTVPRGDLILFPHHPKQDASSITELTQAKSFGNWPTENTGKSTFVQKEKKRKEKRPYFIPYKRIHQT